MKKKKRILVLLTSGLGNCVLALPALAELRRILPDHMLSLAGPPENMALLRSSDIADEWIEIPRDRSPLRHLLEHPRLLFRRYSHIFSFFSCTHGHLIILKKLGLAAHTYAIRNMTEKNFEYDIFIDGKEDISEVEQNLNLLQKAGIPARFRYADLHLTPDEKEFGQRYLQRRSCDSAPLIIHPSWTKQGMLKSLPLQFVSELMSRLRKEGIRCFLLLGKEEMLFLKNSSGTNIPKDEIIAENFTMRQLAGVLSCASLMLSADSGPGHIAAAAGTKVITIWRATDHRRCAVAGKKAAIHIFPDSAIDCMQSCRNQSTADCRSNDAGMSIDFDNISDLIRKNI